MDIFTHNKTLLMKNLHKFFNRHDIPWVNLIWETYYVEGQLPGEQQVGSFLWRANTMLLENYKSLVRCNLGDGKSALFWTDLWSDSIMERKFPHLHSFAVDHNLTVHKVMEDLFHLPLTTQAYEQFLQLEDIRLSLTHSEFFTCTDTWSYMWGSKIYSSGKA